jgi:hypothetical protein
VTRSPELLGHVEHVVFTAMSLKQDARRGDRALAGATKPDADKLKDVVKKLTESLDPRSGSTGTTST